jgi:hypothetical protein
VTETEDLRGDARELAALLREYCAQYGISESRLLALAGMTFASIGQIDRLPAKDLGDCRRRAATLDLELRLNSFAAWADRIDRSSGIEALFDQQLRFLAISDAGRVLQPRNGRTNVIPRESFLGHPYPVVLPGAVSACGGFLFGVARQDWDKLLAGEFAGLQLALEINFPFHHLQGIIEFWPVKTFDRGNLLHSIIHREKPAQRSGRTEGVYVDHIAFA